MQSVSLKPKISSQEELPILTLPENWWSKDYSYSYFTKENNSEIQLLKFNPSLSDEIEFNEILDKNLELVKDWNYSQGDYYVKEQNYANKSKHQNFKSIFGNNFLYIGLAFAIFITFIVMNILVFF